MGSDVFFEKSNGLWYSPYSGTFCFPYFAPESTLLLNFHKMCPMRSQVCRTALIRSALESPDLGVAVTCKRDVGAYETLFLKRKLEQYVEPSKFH